ncbi:hypothetical protein A3J61_02515 [Candidatus Nomurabacteria bacterium RIFCSPHIGHO2_02_FULL_38_15]|uniref:Uncharacterized protein n=1 Tax=Candidatus Nomurabacteria bacterium RIFCSPHIGHO2_02_FULL_38_15 TaxID=1801752 RepID=A0A1F6VPS3_9BACT|nr:MAG: hypothetical protein A3J61_02515 [Candidatus Nomurabacteria bacterium RIFCSPHIGHO2_02_FULL_38_15]
MDNLAQDLNKAKGTPLSVFQNELSKFKDTQKHKNFMSMILPLTIVFLIVSSFLVYRYLTLKKETKLMNESLAAIIKTNEEILLKNKQEGVRVPDAVMGATYKTIEDTKLNGKYGISQEELDKIKNANQ